MNYYHQCCVILFLPEINFLEEKNDWNKINSNLNNIHEITKDFPALKHLYYNQSIELNDIWENDCYLKFIKQGKDLGEKMENAFEYAFNCGFKKIILINTNTEGINLKNLEEALMSLKFIEFSIGPKKNGGYYLIGMNQFEPNVFRNKDWNSDTLYKSTVKDIGNLKFAIYKLPSLE
jgi:hypothetical protein